MAVFTLLKSLVTRPAKVLWGAGLVAGVWWGGHALVECYGMRANTLGFAVHYLSGFFAGGLFSICAWQFICACRRARGPSLPVTNEGVKTALLRAEVQSLSNYFATRPEGKIEAKVSSPLLTVALEQRGSLAKTVLSDVLRIERVISQVGNDYLDYKLVLWLAQRGGMAKHVAIDLAYTPDRDFASDEIRKQMIRSRQQEMRTLLYEAPEADADVARTDEQRIESGIMPPSEACPEVSPGKPDQKLDELTQAEVQSLAEYFAGREGKKIPRSVSEPLLTSVLTRDGDLKGTALHSVFRIELVVRQEEKGRLNYFLETWSGERKAEGFKHITLDLNYPSSWDCAPAEVRRQFIQTGRNEIRALLYNGLSGA